MKKKKENNKRILTTKSLLLLFCFSFFSIFSFSEASSITSGGLFTFTELICPSFVGNTGSVTLMMYDGTDTSGTLIGTGVDTLGTGTNASWWRSFTQPSNNNCIANLENIVTNSGTGDGDYFIQYITPGFTFEYEFTRTGGNWTYIPTPGTNYTNIELVSPLNFSTTTATSTTLSVQYYINSQTHPDLNKLYIDISVINPLLVSGTQGIILDVSDEFSYDTWMSTSTTIQLNNNQKYVWSASLRTKVTSEDCNNPLITVIFCAFQQALQQTIASTPSWSFVIGNNPTDSISNFGQSVFEATAPGSSDLLGGGCVFVATSTCDSTSPSSYSGCLLNAMIAGLCPSANTIAFATTTLMNNFYGKMPFGFFVQPYIKLTNLTNSTSSVPGTDVVVNIPQLGNGTTTVFSWSQAKNFMDNVIGENQVNTIIIVDLVGLTLYCFYRLVGDKRKPE